MLKFGGEKALTKHEELKCHLDENLDDAKIEIVPQIVDNTLHLCAPGHVSDVDVESVVESKPVMVKAKVTKIKTELEQATMQLYDLESGAKSAKVLDIDLDLYQMEDY